MKDVTRICLWSGPRNISTALMYSFAQRADTQVYDEPLYAWYLSHSKAKEYHPGAEEVLRTMEHDGAKVVEMMMGDYDKPVQFFKHMTHQLLDLDRSFMKDVINVILTRDPKDMLPSFDKVIHDPSMIDVGYAQHIELIDYYDEIGVEPIVLDSRQILENPKAGLIKLCNKIGIAFDPAMLNWETGPIPEDGCWAKYWYANVHQSTGFQKYKPKKEPFPDHLMPLLKECQPFYDRLKKLSIKV